MSQPKRQNIYIYDHPESKIRFLEQTLTGKDWRATLVYPDNTPEEQAQLQEAKAAFVKRGYLVQERVNEFRQHTLEIHHLGEGSEPVELIREMGLVKGVGHMLASPSIPVGAALHKLGSAFDHAVKTVKDPAHLNGLIYIAAEAFLFGITKDKKTEIPDAFDRKPGKIWRKVGFGLFLAQSLTYLFAAKSNDDTSFNEFKTKISKTVKKGGNLTELHYEDGEDKPTTGVGSTFVRMLRRYPIEAGALFNNLGMFLYIAGAYKDRAHANMLKTPNALKYIKEGEGLFKLKNAGGFYNDRRGAITSIAAWFLMLLRPKAKTELDGESHEPKNVFARMWEGLRENPQVGTGLLTIAASGQRLAGAQNRKDRSQTIGETIYLLGDLTLLFTKNDHYGKKTGNIDKLADALAGYINQMPLILGPAKQVEMVKNMSNFLLQKGLAEIKHYPKTASFTPEELKDRADLMVLEVGRRVRNSYGEQMEQLGDITARLVAKFPEEKRSALVEQLSQTLAKFSWIYATPEELKPVLEHSVKKLPQVTTPIAAPTTASLRQAVADIAGIMFEVKDASSVAMLYDVLTPFTDHTIKKEQTAVVSRVTQPQPPTQIVTQATRVAPVMQSPHTLSHA